MRKPRTKGGWLFIVIAVISAVAALMPLLRGRTANGTLLAVAGFWLVIAVIVVSRGRASSGADRD